MILAVKSDMKWLAEQLNKKDICFLNDEQYEEVTEVSLLSKDDKARIVVEAVLNRVLQDDKELKKFVVILKIKPEKFKALLEKCKLNNVVCLHGHCLYTLCHICSAHGQPVMEVLRDIIMNS